MKLPIRKEYFDAIKSSIKRHEYRDAHITFVCEETGETISRSICDVELIKAVDVPERYKDKGLFDDDVLIRFELER